MSNPTQKRADLLQDRFALKTVSYLAAGTQDLPHDISERLRAARVQAVAQRKVAVISTRTAPSVVGNGAGAALTLGSDEGLSWWERIGAVLPIVALVLGVLAINSFQSDRRTQ